MPTAMPHRERTPPPHPFWWLPVQGLRHAIHSQGKTAPTGALLHTLCGYSIPRPNPPSDLEWLAKTCESCWEETCILVGLRVRKTTKNDQFSINRKIE
jgi:hypothetical protein